MVTKLFQTEQPTKTLFIKCIAFASCISLIIFILFRYVLIVPKVNAEWYNESWKFREAITFTNSGAATTNQKVLVQFDTATPIAASKMQTSCQDVRFTDAQGMLLQYYINLSGGAGVGCNDASSDFYVLMPTIVAGSNLIYIYYGNSATAAGAVSANFPQSTFSPGAGPTAGSEQVGPGPVAWWHFDEGYDSVAFDSTRFGHNLTLANTAWATSSASFSNRKQYLQFNGATSQASVASSSDLNFGTGSFTISGWFHHPSAIAGTQTIIAKYSTAGWKIYMNSSGYLCFDEDADSTFGGANYDSACSSAIQGSYADSKWHAFEAVKNGTSSITLYVDGIQVAQVTSLSATGSLSSSATLYIGVDTNTNWWNGWLDEMIIYPYARSSAQVLADIEGIHTGTVIGASASDPLTTGLVGYWKMDENTGTSANDTSGNGYTGTWSGSGGSHWVAGKFGSAANYSASDDLITPLDPNPGNLANAFTQRTISAWVTNNNSISGAHIIWEEGGSTNGLALGYRPATSKYVFATSQNGTNVEITSNDTFAINLNWTHVEAVYNAGVMALYVNGILEASGSNGTSIPAHVNAAGIGGVAGADSALTSSVAWTGAIDDVRIYSRAFSPGDVRQLANWAPGPVGWWKMDENTGTAVNDSSGKNNTGVLSGTATPTWTSGKFGSALSFDGSTSYVSAGNDASLQITTAMTLSAWINLKSNASTNDIIARNGASGNYNYRLYTNSTGKLVMEVSTNGTTLVTATGATTLSINTWYYVSGTYQPSTSLTVYVNGVQDGQNTSGIPAQINNTSTVALNIGTENSATSITGAAAFVHECSGSSTSGSIGVTCATTAGNLLVAMIQASTDNTRTFSLSDTGGNTWIECVTCRHQTAGTNNTAELWYSLTTAADTSVTITESGGSTAMISTIEEFSGISGRPLDKSSVGADDTSSTAMTSNATATTSQTN